MSHLCCNLCQLSCLIHRPPIPETNSGLGFAVHDCHLPAIFLPGFLSAFTTVICASILWWLWKPITPSGFDFFGCCFCNMSVLWNSAVSPMSNPQPGGPVALRSEFSFSWTDCFPRLTSSTYPWSGIRVFLLLDRLPTKADKLHPPGFEVRVVPLLGYVGPWHPILYYLDATPLREGCPIRHPGDAQEDYL